MRFIDSYKMLYRYMYMFNTVFFKFYENWVKMKFNEFIVFKFNLFYVIKILYLGRELLEILVYGFIVSY